MDVSRISTSTTILGYPCAFPLYVSAAALAKLGHPEGEVAIVRALKGKGVIQMCATLASCSIEEMASARGPNDIQIFQVCVCVDGEGEGEREGGKNGRKERGRDEENVWGEDGEEKSVRFFCVSKFVSEPHFINISFFHSQLLSALRQPQSGCHDRYNSPRGKSGDESFVRHCGCTLLRAKRKRHEVKGGRTTKYSESGRNWDESTFEFEFNLSRKRTLKIIRVHQNLSLNSSILR